MDALPVELLLNVFDFLAVYPDLVRVALVSHTWRALALCKPSYWRHISIRDPFQDPNRCIPSAMLELAAAQLVRSRNTSATASSDPTLPTCTTDDTISIDIFTDLTQNTAVSEGARDIARFLKLVLSRHIHRVHTMKIQWTDKVLHAACDALLPLPNASPKRRNRALALEELVLRSDHNLSWAARELPELPQGLASAAPHLRTIRLCLVNLPSDPLHTLSFPTVEELYVVRCTGITALEDVVTRFPSLRVLGYDIHRHTSHPQAPYIRLAHSGIAADTNWLAQLETLHAEVLVLEDIMIFAASRGITVPHMSLLDDDARLIEYFNGRLTEWRVAVSTADSDGAAYALEVAPWKDDFHHVPTNLFQLTHTPSGRTLAMRVGVLPAKTITPTGNDALSTLSLTAEIEPRDPSNVSPLDIGSLSIDTELRHLTALSVSDTLWDHLLGAFTSGSRTLPALEELRVFLRDGTTWTRQTRMKLSLPALRVLRLSSQSTVKVAAHDLYTVLSAIGAKPDVPTVTLDNGVQLHRQPTVRETTLSMLAAMAVVEVAE